MVKNVRIKTWEEFKRLAITRKPKNIDISLLKAFQLGISPPSS